MTDFDKQLFLKFLRAFPKKLLIGFNKTMENTALKLNYDLAKYYCGFDTAYPLIDQFIYDNLATFLKDSSWAMVIHEIDQYYGEEL